MSRFSLKGKLLLTFILAAIIPVVIVAIISYTISANTQMQLINQSLRTNQGGVQTIISMIHANVLGVGELVAGNQEVVAAVAEGNGDFLKAYSRRVLNNVNRATAYLTFVDAKGVVLARGHNDTTGDSLADTDRKSVV